MPEMELKRKAYNRLVDWKNNHKGSTAILIDGARRVGKSYLAKSFGSNEYKSYLLIDFNNIPPTIKDIFEYDSYNLNDLFFKLSVFYGIELYERESLIIFDEVQLYPKARGLIKYLVEDGRYDYLETSSLMSIKQNISDIVIPSEEEHLVLNPLDFEEYLWASGDNKTIPFIKDKFEKLEPLGEALNRKIMNEFREYMIVGGMPQSVLDYIKNRDLRSVNEKKQNILDLYYNDISKSKTTYKKKVKSIFELVPSQLAKKEKKFTLSALGKNARLRDYNNAFMWLADGMIINQCFNSTDPSFGLSMNLDYTTQKCYMSDTGLLVTHSLKLEKNTEDETYKSILFDKLGLNEGMFMENIVSQSLRSSGHELYFYSRKGDDSRKDDIEIDFLIRRNREICPIEVKSSSYNRHASLDKFMKKFKGNIGQPYILYQNDIMVKDGIVHLPLYMAFLL